MKKLIAAISATFCAFGASPAFAGAEDHAGFRVGALAGISGDRSPFDDAEFTFGGVVGYDFVVGGSSFLLGVEADITSTNVNTDDFGPRISANARQLSLALRGTYPVGAKTALFTSAGYSNARISGSALGVTVSDNFDGFRIGGGGEYKISNQIYTSLEYRFVDYEVIGGAHQLLFGAGMRF
jgi:outer membrane immunogenic protein